MSKDILTARDADAGWPLVGRDDVLESLIMLLNSPGRTGAVVAGEAGVGKTRLARESLARLADQDVPTEVVIGTKAAASIPFAAFAPILPRGDTPTGADQLELLQSCARSLEERAADRPLVLLVDDANLLDEGSAALVHHLAVGGSTRLLVTLRSREDGPDPILRLWRDGLCERFDLEPLPLSTVGNLIEAAVGGRLAHETVERLANVSGGNPLFLRELVSDGLASGALVRRGGLWQWVGQLVPGRRLIEVIEARLREASTPLREALELLAFGEPLGVDVLQRLAPRANLLDAERQGLVVASASGRRLEVRLAHPLYTEVLRGSIGVLGTRRVQQLLADHLERVGARRRTDALQLATWRLDTGGAIAAGTLELAAADANRSHAYELAERLARATISKRRTSSALFALAEALFGQARFREADAELAAYEAEDDETRAWIAYWRCYTLGFGLGAYEEATEMLARAEAGLADKDWRDFVRAQRACALLYSGHPVEALTVARRLVEDPEVDDLAKIRAVNALVMPRALGGDTAGALQAVFDLVPAALAHREDLPDGIWWVGSMWATTLVFAGRHREAADLVRQSEGGTQGQGASRAARELLLGKVELLNGRPVSAIAHLEEALARMTTHGAGESYRADWGHALLAEARALVGDVDGAQEAAAEAARGPRQIRWLVSYDPERATAWVRVAAGESSRAVDEMLDAAALARASGEVGCEIHALHDALRIGLGSATRRASVCDRLVELAAVMDGDWIPVYVAHATALRDGDGAGLEDASEQFEAIGAHLLAAEAAAEAAGVHAGEGLRARAARASTRAGLLAASCEGARTPALEKGPRPAVLTPREREVAILASKGHSGPEIALRLNVSVRTVNNLLQRVYTKLGVGRSELSSALGANSL